MIVWRRDPRYPSGRVGNVGAIRGRSRIIGTLARRVRACSGLPTDSHNHIAKAIWMAQVLKLHQRYPSATTQFLARFWASPARFST
ncbi:hypothetical protein ACR3G3_001878 [Escherichia coli]